MRSQYPTLFLLFLATSALPVQALELSWVGCGITRNAFMADMAAAYEQKTGVTISIAGGGATKGIRDPAAKKADIGGACRYNLKRNRAETGIKMIPVAWDALVAVVHKDNPVDSITLKQLRDLYLGKLTNWSELGGEDRPIELLIREGKISGVGYSLRKHLFEDYDVEFKSQHIYKSSGPIEKAVEQNVNAIGVTGVASAHKRDFKILQLEGKEPTYENIRTGNYLFYRPLFLIMNVNAPNSQETNKFIQFTLGPEGREIIRNNQVVPYFDGMLLLQNRLKEWKQFMRDALAETADSE